MQFPFYNDINININLVLFCITSFLPLPAAGVAILWNGVPYAPVSSAIVTFCVVIPYPKDVFWIFVFGNFLGNGI